MTTPYISAATLMVIAFVVSFAGLRTKHARAGDVRAT